MSKHPAKSIFCSICYGTFPISAYPPSSLKLTAKYVRCKECGGAAGHHAAKDKTSEAYKKHIPKFKRLIYYHNPHSLTHILANPPNTYYAFNPTTNVTYTLLFTLEESELAMRYSLVFTNMKSLLIEHTFQVMIPKEDVALYMKRFQDSVIEFLRIWKLRLELTDLDMYEMKSQVFWLPIK